MLTVLNLQTGQKASLDYPLRGNRNILKRRCGTIEKVGKNHIGMKLDNGTYRNFSHGRICNFHLIG